MFETLTKLPADPLLGLIAKYSADTNPHKIDLGVGVYKDDTGHSPVMRAVKLAEQALIKTEDSKAYLGSQGVKKFNTQITEMILGKHKYDELRDRITTIHTPGGTAALRVGAEILMRAQPNLKVWLSTPSWVNHRPVMATSGIQIEEYPYLDASGTGVNFDHIHATLKSLSKGDVVLMQASCHNPTGASLTPEQWDAVAELAQEREFIPLWDVAYQGLGGGLDQDVYPIRQLAGKIPEMIIASSCSKNFGLYRERTGALTFIASNRNTAEILETTIADTARTMYSMPPSHGAAVAREILSSAELTEIWRNELEEMRQRLRGLRQSVAQIIHTKDSRLDVSFMERQEGLFSYLGLTPTQMRTLRERYSIYGADSSRINIAGLTSADMDYFANSLVEVMTETL